MAPPSTWSSRRARTPARTHPAAAKPAPARAAGPALIAKQVFVTTGATRGDQVAILKGIKEGDEVVTSGQIKLRNGALVTVNNSVQLPDPN